MKKFFVLLIGVILILGFSTISFAARGVVVLPKTSGEYDIVVSQAGDGDYKNIQDALDEAKEGDTIFVKAGKYEESLYVEANGIKLIGEGKDKVEVIAKNGESVISIADVKGVEVSGFTFTYVAPENDEGNACVWISNGDDISFHDNKAQGATYSGIELSNVQNSKIYNNIAENNKQSGIFVNNVAYNLLIYKNISRNNGYHGLEVTDDGSVPFVFSNNFKENKEAGIYIHDYVGPIIKNNNITGNGHSGIVISKQGRALVVSNEITDNKEDGIYMYKNGSARVISNKLVNNGISGMTINNSFATIINNFILNNKQFGIDAYGKPDEDAEDLYEVTITKNTIQGNSYSGIGCGGNLLKLSASYNLIKSNKEDGILVYEESEGNVFNNLIIGAGLNGIEVRKDARAFVMNNTLVKNETGIYSHDNGYGTYIYNIVAFNKLGIRYKEEDRELKIVHMMNVYWKNKKTNTGIELGDDNFNKDPGFVDEENGNYKVKSDSEFAGWGY